jgi:DNA-directed RNA polymerase omega subunit
MSKTTAPAITDAGKLASELLSGAGSPFRLIILASQRNKQLGRGALSRVEPNPRRTRNTSVAIEEVRRGLVAFTTPV